MAWIGQAREGYRPALAPGGALDEEAGGANADTEAIGKKLVGFDGANCMPCPCPGYVGEQETSRCLGRKIGIAG